MASGLQSQFVPSRRGSTVSKRIRSCSPASFVFCPVKLASPAGVLPTFSKSMAAWKLVLRKVGPDAIPTPVVSAPTHFWSW